MGIIGCGSITKHRHAPEYNDNPHVEEIVFYDRNRERANAMVSEFGGYAVDTVEELLQDESIIAISDCSSNDAHHIHTTKALLHGKHVLCEKPLAISVRHAKEILTAERQSGKKLMVDHNQRLNEAHKIAKRMVEQKELGEVLTFQTSFGHQGPEKWGINKSNSTWYFNEKRAPYGVAGDLGIHKIDLIHYLLDDEIIDVQAFQGAFDKEDQTGSIIQVPDNVVSILRTKKGRIGTASFSWTYYGAEDNSTLLYCQEGIIKMYQDPSYPLIIEKKNGEVIKHELEPMQTNTKQSSSGIIDAFIHSIIKNEEPLITGEQAFTTLKVIEKMLEFSPKKDTEHDDLSNVLS